MPIKPKPIPTLEPVVLAARNRVATRADLPTSIGFLIFQHPVVYQRHDKKPSRIGQAPFAIAIHPDQTMMKRAGTVVEVCHILNDDQATPVKVGPSILGQKRRTKTALPRRKEQRQEVSEKV